MSSEPTGGVTLQSKGTVSSTASRNWHHAVHRPFLQTQAPRKHKTQHRHNITVNIHGLYRRFETCKSHFAAIFSDRYIAPVTKQPNLITLVKLAVVVIAPYAKLAYPDALDGEVMREALFYFCKISLVSVVFVIYQFSEFNTVQMYSVKTSVHGG